MYSITDHYLSNYSIKFKPCKRCTNGFAKLAQDVHLRDATCVLQQNENDVLIAKENEKWVCIKYIFLKKKINSPNTHNPPTN